MLLFTSFVCEKDDGDSGKLELAFHGNAALCITTNAALCVVVDGTIEVGPHKELNAALRKVVLDYSNGSIDNKVQEGFDFVGDLNRPFFLNEAPVIRSSCSGG